MCDLAKPLEHIISAALRGPSATGPNSTRAGYTEELKHGPSPDFGVPSLRYQPETNLDA